MDTGDFEIFVATSNGRLPLEQSSDRRETLAKRVSDDLQHFIFRRRKFVLVIFVPKIWASNQKSGVSEELGFFERHWQIPRRKSVPVIRLFSLYDPWRRGKRPSLCFGPGLGTENDLHHFVFFDIMI